jgi:hypothetical protein
MQQRKEVERMLEIIKKEPGDFLLTWLLGQKI